MNEKYDRTEDERARKNGDLPAGNGACGVNGDSTVITKGLTKRELFAAMAMQGMMANANHAVFIHSHTERAALAVLAADALLKELAK